MMQFGAPGAQYTQGNRLTRLLGGQDLQRLNDGTIGGGLAYALARGFQGYQGERDRRQQVAADQALAQGLQGDGYAGAIRALQGMGENPYAQGRLTQLLMAQAGQQQEQEQRDAQWAREDERFGQRMAAQDQRWQQQFEAEQGARQQAAAADRAFRERMFGLEQAANQQQGAFAGNSMDAQARNILLSADPASPEYAAAYAYASQPRTVFQNGQMVTIQPPMDWAQPPTRGAPPVGQPQAPLASGAMSPAPQRQPAYFSPNQTPPAQSTQMPPAGQQIAPGVTVTPMADPEADRKREGVEETERQTANVVIQDIDRALGLLDEGALLPMAGFVGNLASRVGGTPQADVRALLDTVRANIGFAALQEMRNNSPTGGALGQVSEFENRLLQATQGNLEQWQSEDQLRRNLARIRTTYDRLFNQPITAPEAEIVLRDFEQTAQAPAPGAGQMGRGAAPAGTGGLTAEEIEELRRLEQELGLQ